MLSTGTDQNLAENRLVPIQEAAAFLGVSRAKLYQMMDRGELAYAKVGRCRRIPKKALLEYAEGCLVSSGA